jgi:hypothetical protein
MARTIGAAICAAIWAATSGLAAMQTGNPKDTQLNPDRVAAGGHAIVIGCISREGDGQAPRFVITDTRPQPPARYRLEGDSDLLRFHVGHMVEIAGPLAGAASGGGTANARTLKVEALTYLSLTCTKLQ